MASLEEKTAKYPLEIMNIGMYRSGTTSLSLALKELGYDRRWHLVTNEPSLNETGSKWLIQNADKLLNGDDINFDEWLHTINCNVIMDGPVVFVWQQIFNQYPNCKVILCVRDFDKWSKSYTNALTQLTDLRMRVCKTADKFTEFNWKMWDKHHDGTDHKGMAQLLALKKAKRDEILRREYYDAHIEKVKKIVPKDQLLIFNPSDGYKPLCQFLNKPIPDKEYPLTNTTKEYNQFMTEWKYNGLKSFIKRFIMQKILNLYVLFPFLVIVIGYSFVRRKR